MELDPSSGAAVLARKLVIPDASGILWLALLNTRFYLHMYVPTEYAEQEKFSHGHKSQVQSGPGDVLCDCQQRPEDVSQRPHGMARTRSTISIYWLSC